MTVGVWGSTPLTTILLVFAIQTVHVVVTFGGVWNTLTAVAQNRVRTEFGLRKTVAVGPVT